MTELTGKVGFASPIAHRTFANRRRGIELFATVALAVSLVITATAVSIGMARAQSISTASTNCYAHAFSAPCSRRVKAAFTRSP